MASRTVRTLGCAAALLGAGCPSKQPSSQTASSEDAGRGQIAVKVPLPPGWLAVGRDDGSLRIGPPGEEVLRIDPKPGRGAELPSPAGLERDLRSELNTLEISKVDEEERDDLSLVVLSLSLAHQKQGSMQVLLGAKRVGADLYLCASTPGARVEAVKLAAGACREIHLP